MEHSIAEMLTLRNFPVALSPLYFLLPCHDLRKIFQKEVLFLLKTIGLWNFRFNVSRKKISSMIQNVNVIRALLRLQSHSLCKTIELQKRIVFISGIDGFHLTFIKLFSSNGSETRQSDSNLHFGRATIAALWATWKKRRPLPPPSTDGGNINQERNFREVAHRSCTRVPFS